MAGKFLATTLATAAAATTDELLGGYAPDPTLQLVGRVGFFIALIMVGVLERVQFRLRFLEGRTWWASNGRDVLNASAFLLLSGALALIGFAGPLVLVIAATVLILMIALQTWLGVRPRGTVLSVIAAVALGAPVLAAPATVDRAAREALTFLFR